MDNLIRVTSQAGGISAAADDKNGG